MPVPKKVEVYSEGEMVSEKCDALLFTTMQLEDGYTSKMKSFELERGDTSFVQMASGGYQFHILLFKPENMVETTELFKATLTDCVGYVERICSLGYSGLIVKFDQKENRKKLKAMFKKILISAGLTEKKYLKKVFEDI